MKWDQCFTEICNSLFKISISFGGVIITGMILPFALLIVSVSISNIQNIRILYRTAGVFILIGALLLRFSVVTSRITPVCRILKT